MGRASLPSAAAIALLLTVASSAEAITSTKDAGPEEVAVDAALDGGDDDAAEDAAYCPPPVEPPHVAGGIGPPRVHGTGCGCGGSSGDDETGMAMVAAASLVALLRRL
jgi:MYXO-CTERM domain-containing protein